jgi:PPK2 family polyphosphate:nucleotide phosphotransferase
LIVAGQWGGNLPVARHFDFQGSSMDKRKLAARYRVKPGTKVNLRKYTTDASGLQESEKMDDATMKEHVVKGLESIREELSDAQELLYASNKHSVLIIFQAIDAGGKDSTIRHVMSGVNPQGCHVTSFKVPSSKELSHNFLWRASKALPARGMIGIFNRSYYEETIVVRVRPELLVHQRLPGKVGSKKFWNARYEDINNFEKHLARNGTVILKFFLHLSKEEQKERFMDRLTKPKKHWKFSAADLNERDRWDDYQKAFQDTIENTSTKWAPWYIIPADRKPISRAVVAAIITSTIEDLKLKYPKPTAEDMKVIEEARKRLESE